MVVKKLVEENRARHFKANFGRVCGLFSPCTKIKNSHSVYKLMNTTTFTSHTTLNYYSDVE